MVKKGMVEGIEVEHADVQSGLASARSALSRRLLASHFRTTSRAEQGVRPQGCDGRVEAAATSSFSRTIATHEQRESVLHEAEVRDLEHLPQVRDVGEDDAQTAQHQDRGLIQETMPSSWSISARFARYSACTLRAPSYAILSPSALGHLHLL